MIDTNEIFNSIGDAESAVKIRKNATTYRCSRRRRQEVHEAWVQDMGKRHRVRAIEGIFS